MISYAKNDSTQTNLFKNNSSENQGFEVYSPQRYSLLAIQAIISALLNLLHFPVTLLTFLCLLPSEMQRGYIIFNLLLCSGVITILQSMVGIKFPVLVSPSNLFISGSILFFKSPLWEIYSNGDLYAMGNSLRYEEFTIRTGELRGILILCGFIFSIVCGILWYLPLKLPSATISATLISVSLLNVSQILCEKEISLYGNGNKLLDKSIASYQWYSFNLPFKDFILPKFSTKSLIMLPVFCSQFITSYCCFQALSKEKEMYLKALILENIFTVVVAAIGVIIPLTVDPISIGLIQMTKVKHTESSVIAGGLLVLFSVVVKLVALLSYLSHPILCGISLFMYGQLLDKGLEEMTSDKTESSIIAMSVLCGLVFSSASIGIERNIMYSIAVLIIKSPILITFVMSVLLSVAFKMFSKK